MKSQSSSRPSEELAGSPLLILEREGSAGPSLRATAQFSSESKQSKNARENSQDGMQFMDSSSRIIVHDNGSAACYPLLLNKDPVEKQREILEYCRNREHLKRKLGGARIGVTITQDKLNYKKRFTRRTKQREGINYFRDRLSD